MKDGEFLDGYVLIILTCLHVGLGLRFNLVTSAFIGLPILAYMTFNIRK
jgi:hypothetical protein